jgi:predicted Zn-dependent protease with MMP-like domain
MITVSDEQFSHYIQEALDHMPAEHMKALHNVAVVYEDEPSAAQRTELKLQCHETLFGLYEGVPLAKRQGITSYPPDKITIFKAPMERAVDTIPQLKEEVRHTVWHEVAHYFGLDHDQIHALERRG